MKFFIRIGFVFAIGFVVAILTIDTSISSQQYFDSIVAKQFILVDENRNPRGGMGFTDEGWPFVTLLNKAGKDVVRLIVDKAGPSLDIDDADGNLRISMTLVNNSDPEIFLWSKGHKSFVNLSAFDQGGGRLMFVDENKGHRASIGYKNGKASLAVKGADKYSGAYITAYDNDGVHINIADSNLRSNLTLRSTDNELAMIMAAQKRTGLFYQAARGDVPNLAIIRDGEPIWKALPGAPAPASDIPDIVDLIK